jgi:hypothetical protein
MSGKEMAFPMPFQPYRVQQALMQQLWDAIQERQIGVFESPTGTVRSWLWSKLEATLRLNPKPAQACD